MLHHCVSPFSLSTKALLKEKYFLKSKALIQPFESQGAKHMSLSKNTDFLVEPG